MPSLVLERATADDDGAVRALLARVPMDGEIRLSFEREPDASHSATVEGDRHHTFVVRDGEGRVAGLCSRAVRRVFINASEERIGYLGQLRAERSIAGRLQLLSDGFAACRDTRTPDELRFDVTSIMEGNGRARRLLERGLPGLPRYTPLTTFKTFLFPKGQRVKRGIAKTELVRGSVATASEIAGFLQRQYRRFQLAPVWTEGDLLSVEATRDLSMDDFVIATRASRIVGCAALWDQSRYRQTVVRGYSPWIARSRHLLNGWYRLTGLPRLPPIGAAVRLLSISHFAVDGDEPEIARALLGEVFRRAEERDVDYLVLGVAAQHPLAPLLHAAFRSRVLTSILYTVQYDAAMPPELDGRIPHLEVATL